MASTAEKFDLPDLMRPEQVAEWLGLLDDEDKPSTKAVYNMVARGEFPAEAIVRIGARLRFDADELRRWLAEKRGPREKAR